MRKKTGFLPVSGWPGKWIWLSVFICLFSGLNLVTAEEPLSENPGYRLGPEDVLSISVWEDERLTREVLVRPDGMISFPLIGEVEAAGHTAAAVRTEIVRLLKRFIPDPSVLVTVQAIRSYTIYVVGKVNRPGAFPVGHQIDVLQALALAGGVAPFSAENKIKILRREKGVQKVYLFKYGEIKKGKRLEQNILLLRGDTVVVP